MEIIRLTKNYPCYSNLFVSFVIKLPNIKDIWIFNCHEACQHSLIIQHIKISQITKIIITDLHIENISGLLGLLSSLSLIKRVKELHIYGPIGLVHYIEFGKKYAQTNFCYDLYIHVLSTSRVLVNDMYNFYVFLDNLYFRGLLIFKAENGKFRLRKASDFNLVSGPMYGALKRGNNFLLPDGFVMDGYNFSEYHIPGFKVAILMSKYHTRCSMELTYYAKFLYSVV